MTVPLKPLNPDDEVYIRRLNMYGKVMRVRPGDRDEPEHERLYTIQITQFFRRTDLELYDYEAEREQRDAGSREKRSHLATVNEKVQAFVAAGGDLKSPEGTALGIELWLAVDSVSVDLGNKPMLRPKDDLDK